MPIVNQSAPPQSHQETAPPDKSDGFLRRFSDNLTFFFKLSAQLLVLLAVLGFLAYFIHLQSARNFRVVIVNVPTIVASTGVSPDVARHMLAQRLSRLQDLSNTTIDHRFQVEPTRIDFTIPQTSLTFQNLVSWTQGALGHDDTIVSLDLVLRKSNELEMTPRVRDHTGQLQYLRTLYGTDFDDLLDQGAREILRQVNPLVSGTAVLAIVKDECLRSPDGCSAPLFKEAIVDLQRETHNSALSVFHRAYISLADLYAVSGNHETAIAYLTNLIQLVESDHVNDSAVLDAYLMRGVEYTARGAHDLAVKDFRHVTDSPSPVKHGDCDQLHTYAYEDLAADLISRHPEPYSESAAPDFKEALDDYQRSLDYCLDNSSAKAARGYALSLMKRYEEASETLRDVLKKHGNSPARTRISAIRCANPRCKTCRTPSEKRRSGTAEA
jgi:tetratricopeptide (TPR) repeat protein